MQNLQLISCPTTLQNMPAFIYFMQMSLHVSKRHCIQHPLLSHLLSDQRLLFLSP